MCLGTLVPGAERPHGVSLALDFEVSLLVAARQFPSLFVGLSVLARLAQDLTRYAEFLGSGWCRRVLKHICCLLSVSLPVAPSDKAAPESMDLAILRGHLVEYYRCGFVGGCFDQSTEGFAQGGLGEVFLSEAIRIAVAERRDVASALVS